MPFRKTGSKDGLRDVFTVAVISLLEEEFNSAVFSNIRNIFRDIYSQKLENILMASGSKMEVKIKFQANRYLTATPGEISISGLTSEDDDAIVIVTDSSNVQVGRDTMNKIAKTNEVGIVSIQMKIIDGGHGSSSGPYPWEITNRDTANLSPLFINTMTTDDQPQQTTNDRNTDKFETGNDTTLAAGVPSPSVRSSGSELDVVADRCFRRRNTFSTRSAVKQKKNGRTTDSSRSKSCEKSLDDISDGCFRRPNIFSPRSAVKQKKNDRTTDSGTSKSSEQSLDDISDSCFRRRNTFSTRSAVKQKKNGRTTDSGTSKSSEQSLDDISDGCFRRRNTFSTRSAVKQKKNDRTTDSGTSKSSEQSLDDISDGCFRRRNTFSTRSAVKQKKNDRTPDSSTSKSREQCELIPCNIPEIQKKVYGTVNSGLLIKSQRERKSDHPCRQSFHESSYVDMMMNLHCQLVQKTTDMDGRLAKLSDETSRLFPVMPTKRNMKEPESTLSTLKVWKAPFIACAQVFHGASASENSKTEASEQLTKNQLNDKKEICLSNERKSDVFEKYNFPKILMKMRLEESQNKQPSIECANPRSNASLPCVGVSLNSVEFVDIFENLCQTVRQMAISPSSRRRNTDTSLIKKLLKNITKKRKVTA